MAAGVLDCDLSTRWGTVFRGYLELIHTHTCQPWLWHVGQPSKAAVGVALWIGLASAEAVSAQFAGGKPTPQRSAACAIIHGDTISICR